MSALGKFSPDTLHQRLVTLGEDWAEKQAAADLLEETKKSVLSQIALRSNVKSMSEREAHALASPDYREHVAAMVEARKEANKAKINYHAAQAWLDLARSMEATRRAEANLR